jgi:peptidyl-Lys metalloendopeptidase
MVLAGAMLAPQITALATRKAGLSATVDGPGFVARGERPIVQVTVFNDSGDADLVSWQTPFRGVNGNIFDVRRDGQPVAYIGALYKFAAPEAEDYVNIPAGNARSVAVDLSRFYDFSRAGQYTVQFRVALQDALGDDVAPGLASNVAAMGVERDERRSAAQPSAKPIKSACTPDQTAILNTAKTNAADYSARAYNYLLSNPTDSLDLYRTWFDASGDKYRWPEVENNFAEIHSALTTKTVTFNCNCKQNVYAYVYATRPYEITLCRVFWRVPDTGMDSKAGTLIHEISHFNVVAGTNDWAYGQTPAKDLAETDPAKATTNADNHEYFAESQPPVEP